MRIVLDEKRGCVCWWVRGSVFEPLYTFKQIQLSFISFWVRIQLMTVSVLLTDFQPYILVFFSVGSWILTHWLAL